MNKSKILKPMVVIAALLITGTAGMLVRSAIAGLVEPVTKGKVVSPQSGILTTIVSVDPIYVLFPVSQRALMRARKDASTVELAGRGVTSSW